MWSPSCFASCCSVVRRRFRMQIYISTSTGMFVLMLFVLMLFVLMLFVLVLFVLVLFVLVLFVLVAMTGAIMPRVPGTGIGSNSDVDTANARPTAGSVPMAVLLRCAITLAPRSAWASGNADTAAVSLLLSRAVRLMLVLRLASRPVAGVTPITVRMPAPLS